MLRTYFTYFRNVPNGCFQTSRLQATLDKMPPESDFRVRTSVLSSTRKKKVPRTTHAVFSLRAYEFLPSMPLAYILQAVHLNL